MLNEETSHCVGIHPIYVGKRNFSILIIKGSFDTNYGG